MELIHMFARNVVMAPSQKLTFQGPFLINENEFCIRLYFSIFFEFFLSTCSEKPCIQTMSQILVSVQNTNPILAIETSLVDFMGYAPRFLIEQSFKVFTGPQTDCDMIGRAVIEASFSATFTESSTVLYDINGVPRRAMLSFSPCSRAPGRPICCLVTIHILHGIDLESNSSLSNGDNKAADIPLEKPFDDYDASFDDGSDEQDGWSGFGGQCGWPEWANKDTGST
jgi:hypothetical protein